MYNKKCIYYLQKINEAITEEYLDRVFEAIKSNTELDNLQEGIGIFYF